MRGIEEDRERGGRERGKRMDTDNMTMEWFKKEHNKCWNSKVFGCKRKFANEKIGCQCDEMKRFHKKSMNNVCGDMILSYFHVGRNFGQFDVGFETKITLLL